MTSNSSASVNDDVRKLLESWCERREYRALVSVLPAWCAANSLLEGAPALRDALRTTYTLCGHLPNHEREMLKDISDKMDNS